MAVKENEENTHLEENQTVVENSNNSKISNNSFQQNRENKLENSLTRDESLVNSTREIEDNPTSIDVQMCIKNEDGNYSYLYPVINPNIQFASVPSGIIVMYGNSSTIPDGWVLCNGENNIPDLRGKFILGNSDEYAVGSTGGEKEHTLTIEEIPAHGHTNIFNYGTTSGSLGNAFTMNASPQDIITQNSVEVGNNQPHNNMPPYYVLCYIMKV